MKYAVIAAIMFASSALAQTPCDIANAFQSELDANKKQHRSIRKEVSKALTKAVTAENRDAIDGIFGLLFKMASTDARSALKTQPLRNALLDQCD